MVGVYLLSLKRRSNLYDIYVKNEKLIYNLKQNKSAMSSLSVFEMDSVEQRRQRYIREVKYDLCEKTEIYSVMYGVNENGNRVDLDGKMHIGHRMCLVGRPTMGKTTILDYLLCEWIQQTMLQQYKWVFKFDRDNLFNMVYETIESLIPDCHLSCEKYFPVYFKTCMEKW